MSRFSHAYKPIGSFEIIHNKEFLAEEHLKIVPDPITAGLIKQYHLHIMSNSKGLVVLYKKYEHFDPITKDDHIEIDGVQVVYKKVIGYQKKGTSSNRLPSPANFTLTFWGIANATFKKNTKWDNLPLNKYIKYSKTSLKGVETVDDTIISNTKPDAVFELKLTNANVVAENETKFQFKIITI